MADVRHKGGRFVGEEIEVMVSKYFIEKKTHRGNKMTTYFVDEKPFDTLDEARAFAVSVLSRTNRISAVEVYSSGAHTWIYKGLVIREKGGFYWQANGIWVLNKKGKIIERLV